MNPQYYMLQQQQQQQQHYKFSIFMAHWLNQPMSGPIFLVGWPTH
jgi:hypothetical protein